MNDVVHHVVVDSCGWPAAAVAAAAVTGDGCQCRMYRDFKTFGGRAA